MITIPTETCKQTIKQIQYLLKPANKTTNTLPYTQYLLKLKTTKTTSEIPNAILPSIDNDLTPDKKRFKYTYAISNEESVPEL